MGLPTERVRRASKDERGFTMVELLIVMLILAILASIAMPALLNQKTKANDAKAKQRAHTTQVAMETCGTANTTPKVFTGCNIAALRAIDPSIPLTGVTVATPGGGGYTITVTVTEGNTFQIIRAATGGITYPCAVPDAATTRGGCPGAIKNKSGKWPAGTWG